MVTGCFACEGFEEFYVGLEVDCVGFCDGLWCVYMFYLFEADKHW